MIRKEPRYRFAREKGSEGRRVAQVEFEWYPPARRFDAISAVAAGIILTFGWLFVSELILTGGVSGQLAKLTAAADQAKHALVDVWRTPFRRIEDALVNR